MEDLKSSNQHKGCDMHDNVYVDTYEDYMEHDSLSSDSFSKDSLLNGHNIQSQNLINNNKRRRSFTFEDSSRMNTSIRTHQISQLEDSEAHSHFQSFAAQQSFNKANAQKSNMSQSMYERPWLNSTTINTLSSANAKLREEKLQMAKEDHQRKLNQKIAGLNESERLAENARQRKEIESQKKIEEKKRKYLERQRIVEERKKRLIKAEEARQKTILRKLVNNSARKPSPQYSNSMMTMSCYGGFVNVKTKPGNKEVVCNRFGVVRPTSSTGKVMGFGSSSPRPICQNTVKLNKENKKIPEAILIKCELLSRPLSSRIPERMTTSITAPQHSNTLPRKPQRQGSLKDKDAFKGVTKQPAMITSMMDVSSKTKLKHNKPISPQDVSIKDNVHSKKNKAHLIQNKIEETRSCSALSASSKTSEYNLINQATAYSKSGTLPKNKKKTKVDTHIDSDSIEEEGFVIEKTHNPMNSVANNNNICMENTSIAVMVTKDSPNIGIGRAPPTKDVSEIEYKARLIENRRLVREKREKERELLIQFEREKRHAEEIAAREILEIERDVNFSAEETHLTTSNDDTLDGPMESRKKYLDKKSDEELQLSEIAETPSVASNGLTILPNNDNEEKNERKKKLNSIMSRVRKTNEESSSDGGVSPRRAMSPEQVELENDINNSQSLPAFRSSLLQSMFNIGRLANASNASKDGTEGSLNKEFISNNYENNLTSVNESTEDSESKVNLTTFVASVATEEEFAFSDIAREDCEGKEDSISSKDKLKKFECLKNEELKPRDNVAQELSISSLIIDSVYNADNIHMVIQN